MTRFVPIMVVKGKVVADGTIFPIRGVKVHISGKLIDQRQTKFTFTNGRFKFVIPMTTENRFRIHVGPGPLSLGIGTVDIILSPRGWRSVYDLGLIEVSIP